MYIYTQSHKLSYTYTDTSILPAFFSPELSKIRSNVRIPQLHNSRAKKKKKYE